MNATTKMALRSLPMPFIALMPITLTRKTAGRAPCQSACLDFTWLSRCREIQ